MILCDVNVLLHAVMAQSQHHALCRRELESALAQESFLAIADQVLAAVVRIATHPKIFQPTPAPRAVFAYVNALRDHPHTVPVAPGRRHWRLFQDLVASSAVRGADTTDAWFAALAIEHACEWWTTDTDFGRFPGLRWRDLLAAT